MIHQTIHAREQVRALRAFYLEKERYEAYRKMIEAIRTARSRIEADPNGGASHPPPYPGMTRWGFHWIKVHRYWFGWSMSRGHPVITNMFYDRSRMWARVAPDEGEQEPFQADGPGGKKRKDPNGYRGWFESEASSRNLRHRGRDRFIRYVAEKAPLTSPF